MPIVKEINWSYPSSSNAAKAGMSKSGCFSLSKGEHIKPKKFVRGFATLAEAKAFADTMPEAYSKFTL